MTKEERLKVIYDYVDRILADDSLTDEDICDFDMIQESLIGIAQAWDVEL